MKDEKSSAAAGRASTGITGEIVADDLLPLLHVISAVPVIAKHGSMIGAAEVLARSPASLARGVADLERTLSMRLIERRGGVIWLTAQGEKMLGRFETVAMELADGLAEMVRKPGVSRAAASHLLHDGRKLRLLMQVGEDGTISSAAAALGMSQPAMSMALARIERSLGIALFQRTLRGVLPTEAGSRLVQRASRARAELRYALADLGEIGEPRAATLVIGALPMARAEMLPIAIRATLDRATSVRIQVVEAKRDTLLSDLRSGKIDAVLAVLDDSAETSDLVVEPLQIDRLGVVAGRSHPFARRGNLSLEEIAGIPSWILPHEKAVSRKLFDGQFVARGLSKPIANVETGDLLVIRPLLAEGDMLAFVSLALVAAEISSGELVPIDVDMPVLGREVVLLHRASASLPAAMLMLLAEIRAVSKR